ncbi:vesicle-associated membrane protein 3-like isoform X1 [Biomphalaria glabrata]|uniref:Vesicle-associated membrane protein 3-like isoform X1 n=2 Tax=Biomphalaria glabrata TaxID=6526 RepID=A0A2C9LDH6_BIOGL|nr:vesicle-associated membrane protein 3-like isoform X1 [Biomphalaria glabrata]
MNNNHERGAQFNMAYSNARRTDNLDHLQNEVSEVTSLLKDNVEKVLQRGERIDTLQSRSEDLENNSTQFKRAAVQIKKKMWWKNCKMACILGSVIFLIIAIIIIVILVETKPWESSGGHSGNGSHVEHLPSTIRPPISFQHN